MFTYLISYDLAGPETRADYKQLIDYIKSNFASWAKPHKSLWIVKSTQPIQAIRDNLRQKVDANDKILILDVSKDNWASYNLSSDVAEWMQNNL